MEVGTDVTHYGAGPKQLAFGPTGSGQYNVESPKRAPLRAVVETPATSAEQVKGMTHEKRVSEVHRIFEQGKADAESAAGVKEAVDNHANWLKLFKALIVDIQQKVQAVTSQAVDNDTALKTSIAATDAELKEKLRLLEMIVTEQGEDIKRMKEQKMDERLSSGLQTLDSKYGQSIAVLEAAVRGLREEMPARLTEVSAAMANMGANVTGRLNAVETEIALQADVSTTVPGSAPGATAAFFQAPPGFSGSATAPGMAPGTAAAFPQCAAAGDFAAPMPGHIAPTHVPVSATAPSQFHRPAGGMPPGAMPQHHFVGDRDSHRSLFDDKIAGMANTAYPMPAQLHHEVPIDKKIAWAKTNRNYFISKAGELEMLLKHVESFGTDPVTIGHIEDMGNRGFMTEYSPAGTCGATLTSTSRLRAGIGRSSTTRLRETVSTHGGGWWSRWPRTRWSACLKCTETSRAPRRPRR